MTAAPNVTVNAAFGGGDFDHFDCAPVLILDAGHWRERCAHCGERFAPHVRHVARVVGAGHAYHLACAPEEPQP